MGKISSRAFKVPFLPFTFNTAIKKETGKNLNQNYREMMAELKDLWGNQTKGLNLTPFKTVNQRKDEAFTNYQFPRVLPDGRILALKAGIGDIQQFVTIDQSGNEKRDLHLGS